MDEMRRQLDDQVNSTMEQSSGLFNRLNVSFMLFINAHDDLGATFDLNTYLWTTSSQRGNQLYENLVFWLVLTGLKLAVVHFYE